MRLKKEGAKELKRMVSRVMVGLFGMILDNYVETMREDTPKGLFIPIALTKGNTVAQNTSLANVKLINGLIDQEEVIVTGLILLIMKAQFQPIPTLIQGLGP